MDLAVPNIKNFFKWIYKASGRIWAHLVVGTFLGLFRVIFGLLFVLQSKHMIDIATRVIDGNIWKEVVFLVVIILLELLFGVISSYLFTHVESLMKNNLRERLFSHLLISPLYKRGGVHSGDLTSRLEEDVSIVTSNIVLSLPSVIVTGFQLSAAFWLLTQFDHRLAWIIVFILPFFMILGKVIGVRLRKMTKEIREDQSLVQSKLVEGLQHSSLLRSLEAECLVTGAFRVLQNQLYKKIMKRTRFTLVSRSMMSLGFISGYLVAFFWGCLNLYQGLISFGVMTAFLQLVGKIQSPTVNLAQLVVGFIHATTSVDRLIEIENFKTETPSEKKPLKGVPGIRFEKVSFTYPNEDRSIYQAFSHDFLPGSHTAILGPTGMGKTTLIRLILALVEPNDGKVIIYDKEESSVVSPGSRCNISYVPQGNTLLSGSIRDNLLLANPLATEDEIAQALHTAVADFVYDLPEGLDTLCGERGKGLSEGQAQRIAIARGLLKPASIFLFDEISSSLDKETEALLFKRLNMHTSAKTLILITHRTDITGYCDQILQL